MKAKLFVKGMREPVELEENEGKAAESLIGDTAKSLATPFKIEGVWSGRKDDMKFVVWDKSDASYAGGVKYIQPMSPMEARAFAVEIAQDKRKSCEVWGAEKEYKWKDQFLARKGAIRIEYWVSKLGMKIDNVIVCDIPLLKTLEDKIESYDRFKDKLNYGTKKQEEAYAKIAEEIRGLFKNPDSIKAPSYYETQRRNVLGGRLVDSLKSLIATKS